MIELLRELGVSASATSTVGGSGMIGIPEANQEKLASKLSINRPETLAKLRASYQNFTRTEREDLRRYRTSPDAPSPSFAGGGRQRACFPRRLRG